MGRRVLLWHRLRHETLGDRGDRRWHSNRVHLRGHANLDGAQASGVRDDLSPRGTVYWPGAGIGTSVLCPAAALGAWADPNPVFEKRNFRVALVTVLQIAIPSDVLGHPAPGAHRLCTGADRFLAIRPVPTHRTRFGRADRLSRPDPHR